MTRFTLAACVLVAASCSDDEPVYPIEPQIEFKQLRFVAGRTNVNKDTVILRFYYTDGDMDLGLSPNATNAPYHYKNYFLAENGQIERVATKENPDSWFGHDFLAPASFQKGTLVNYRTRKEPGYETLLPAYDCRYYSIYDSVYVTQDHASMIGDCHVARIQQTPGMPKTYVIYDTLLMEENPNHYNIHIEYFVLQPDGSFVLQNFKTNKCIGQDFSGRFPEIDQVKTGRFEDGAFKIFRESRNTGTIEYGMASVGHQVLFGGKKIKLRFNIRDRALNVSNTIETDLLEIPPM